MDTQRILLFFTLSVVLLLIWQAWIDDKDAARATAPVAELTAPSDVPMTPPAASDMPASPDAQSSPAIGSAPELPPPTPAALARSTRISVTTDVFEAEIDTAGGDLRQVLLIDYPITSADPDQPFPLMEDRGQRIFIAQSGLLSRDGPAPDHYAQFTAEQTVFELAPGASELRVPLVWETPEGLRVTKVYTFHRGSYLIDVEHIVENGSATPWSGYVYHQLQRTRPTDQEGSWFIYTYTGAVLSTPNRAIRRSASTIWTTRTCSVKCRVAGPR